MNNRGFKPKFAPVKVGDEFDVKIEAIGEKGDGIAKKEGFVLFVPNTKQGDEVKIKVTRVLRSVGFAEVVGQGDAKEAQTEAPIETEQESSEQESAAEESEAADTEDFGEESEEDKKEQ